MELSQYLVALARDGAAFAEVVTGRLEVPVPSCPGWTLADLTWHVAEVNYFWGNIVEHRHAEPHFVADPSRPDEANLLEWYRRELAHLERVLATADPDARHWTWSHQRDTAFVIRRMAHEMAIHLWDARNAVGERGPIPTALAADGIDEFLGHFAPDRSDGAPPVGGRVEFASSETAAVWRTEGIGDADAVVTGTASDILLVLWRRLPLDAVAIDGDAAVVARLVEGTALR